jgi:hypothetical protein
LADVARAAGPENVAFVCEPETPAVRISRSTAYGRRGRLAGRPWVPYIKEIATWGQALPLDGDRLLQPLEMGATWRCANHAVLAGETLHLR